MGIFDSVYIPCPACGETIELQSKRADGGPSMLIFSRNEVPAAIAVDLNNSSAWCPGCAKTWKVRAAKLKPVYRLKLVEKNNDEEDV